ncbi:MAG: ATP-dependent DNA ligase [Micropruina glycogenica]
MPEAPVELNVDGRTVRISSPSKPYFPGLGLNKLQVAIFPGCRAGHSGRVERPTHNHGALAQRGRRGLVTGQPVESDGDAFYQKRAPKGMPDWVQTATVRFPSGRPAVQVCPADLATIVWMVNLGTVRFHPWPVQAPQTDLVDQLRIDLDPQPGTDFADAVAAALVLREVLTEAGLTGFAKTPVEAAACVFAPIVPSDFIDARHATIAIGRELARRLPDEVTVNWWKEERGEAHLRRLQPDGARPADDVGVLEFGPRRPGRVSAPLTWDGLASVAR